MSAIQNRPLKAIYSLREVVTPSVFISLYIGSWNIETRVSSQDPFAEQRVGKPQQIPSPLPVPSNPRSNSKSTIVPLAPLANDPKDRVSMQSNLDQITLVTRDAPLSTVLSMIAEQQGLNIVTGEEVSQQVNVTLNNVRMVDALDAILAVHGYTWTRQNNIVIISSMSSDRKTSPSVQGRMVRVFTLN